MDINQDSKLYTALPELPALPAGSVSALDTQLQPPRFTPGIKEIYTITNNSGRNEKEKTEIEKEKEQVDVDLVVANGGGGQIGMIAHLTYSYLLTSTTPHSKGKSKRVAWYASNTNDSHDALQRGVADIAIVYDVKRVQRDVEKGVVVEEQVVHCWMDRCCLIGPCDFDFIGGGFIGGGGSVGGGVERLVREIMKCKGGYLMTRVDESTSHVKERALVSTVIAKIRQEFGMERIGYRDILDMYVYMGYTRMPVEMQKESHVHFTTDQVEKCLAFLQRDQSHPRYTDYIKAVRPDFYRPLRLMPLQAACKANQIGSFLLCDYGIFRHLRKEDKNKIKVYMDGTEPSLCPSDKNFFLNPAVAIMSSKSKRKEQAKAFMSFLKKEETQRKIVPAFKTKCGTSYFESPHTDWFTRQFLGLQLHETCL